MERLGELTVMLSVLGTVAVILLDRGSDWRASRIVAASLLGVGGAFAVLVQQVDVVPDELEMPFAFAALLALLLTIAWLHFRERPPS